MSVRRGSFSARARCVRRPAVSCPMTLKYVVAPDTCFLFQRAHDFVNLFSDAAFEVLPVSSRGLDELLG